MTTLSARYAQDALFRADAAGFSAKTPCFVAALAARTMSSAHFSACDVKVLALILGLGDKSAANRKAIRLGVDIIATDKPEELVRLRK